METEPLVHCPICNEDLPESAFGISRARKTGKNKYCKSCVRAKVYKFRKGRDSWRQVKKQRRIKMAKIAAEMAANPERQQEMFTGKLPPQLVLEAIAIGNHTQKQIRQETKLSKDQICDALAILLLWTKDIKTEVINDTRVYLLNNSGLRAVKPIPFAELVGRAA